ncbi:hypothetical protein PST93_20735, partial [Yersinia pestis]|nr:hypothetical protein [Yersinia pestis]
FFFFFREDEFFIFQNVAFMSVHIRPWPKWASQHWIDDKIATHWYIIEKERYKERRREILYMVCK